MGKEIVSSCTPTLAQREKAYAAANAMFYLYCVLSRLFDDDNLYGWGDRNSNDDIKLWYRVMSIKEHD